MNNMCVTLRDCSLLQKEFVRAGEMPFLGADSPTALLFAAKNDGLQGRVREPPLLMHFQGRVTPPPAPGKLFCRGG